MLERGLGSDINREEEEEEVCVNNKKREESHLNENHIQIQGEDWAGEANGLEGFCIMATKANVTKLLCSSKQMLQET